MTTTITQKIFPSKDDLLKMVSSWKANGEKIVFTNGCFDLIHLGHIHYLEEASQLGSKLIVALNSDRSVSAIKGSHRPINDEKTRCAVMAAFYFVDAVIIFDESTPYEIIENIKPHVLVKGGDWKPNEIIGSDVVIANGGEVKSLHFVDGYSTTNIETKIIDAHKNIQ